MFPDKKRGLPTWTPILGPTDRLSARAWDAINAITEALVFKTYLPMQNKQRGDPSYGEPLLYGYLALATREQRWLDSTLVHLNAAIDRAESLRYYLGLFEGLSGLGWVVEHLSNVLESDEDYAGAEEGSEAEEKESRNLNQVTDAALITDLRRGPWRGPYDLVGGLVGLGIYFLERLPTETAVLGIRLVLDHLDNLAQRTDSGLTWHTSQALLPDWQRKRCPGGYYNLGVAHGIPGVLFLLSEISISGVEEERALSMLSSAMDWFLAQRRTAGSRSWYNPWIPTPGEASDSRLAWCYGDLGIVAVLHQVARRRERVDWQTFADDLLSHCLAWPMEESGAFDAPLCHGATGNAHIFNRLYQVNRDPRCRQAALAWYERALDMRQTEGGVGGFFQFSRPVPDGPPFLEPSPAFLDGALGIALGMLAAVTPVEPKWDRMLLLSGRTWDTDNASR